MSRYIKLDDMRAIFCQSNSITQAWNGFDRLPSIDIVRCKECGGWNHMRDGVGRCDAHLISTRADDFCSYGEREGE